MRRKSIDSPTFGSLFSGCGGFDLGFIQSGFRCVAAFDVDPVAVRTLKANLGTPAEVRDLADNHGDLCALRGVDVLLAGPPCQGFSTAGRRAFDDPRNQLLLVAGQIAAAYRPKVVVIENVAGARAGSHKAYWDGLTDILHGAGYHTAELVCDASRHGLAQMRRRVIKFAWRDRVDFEVKLEVGHPKTLKDVLKGINGAANHEPTLLEPSSEAGRIAARVRPGQKLCNVRDGDTAVHTWDIPEIFGRVSEVESQVLHALLKLRRRLRLRDSGDADPVLASDVSKEVGYPCAVILERLVQKDYVRKIGHRYDLKHTFNGKFRRLTWDGLSYTVDTRFTQPRYFLHPDENRGFTVREAARIQGFPDSFVFAGSQQQQSTMVGNAVAPPVAREIAALIRRSLLEI